MTAPVFLVPAVRQAGRALPLGELDVGGAAVFGGNEGGHAARSLRLLQGERADLVDGCGLRLTCEVLAANRDRGEIEFKVLEKTQEPERFPKLTLVQSLAKSGRDEQAIESATELGVDRIIPWQADRSIVRWKGSKGERALSKWQSVIAAATKQSRRARIPELLAPASSSELAAKVRQLKAGGETVLVCHEEASSSLKDAASAALGKGDLAGITVVVGPEGGISGAELAALQSAGATPVLLGPEVLRSSSAGPAALVALNLLAGRW